MRPLVWSYVLSPKVLACPPLGRSNPWLAQWLLVEHRVQPLESRNASGSRRWQGHPGSDILNPEPKPFRWPCHINPSSIAAFCIPGLLGSRMSPHDRPQPNISFSCMNSKPMEASTPTKGRCALLIPPAYKPNSKDLALKNPGGVAYSHGGRSPELAPCPPPPPISHTGRGSGGVGCL